MSTIDPKQLEASLRAMPWRTLMDILIKAAPDAEELPMLTRRWFELNRADTADLAKAHDVLERLKKSPAEHGWLSNKLETAPMLGWIIHLGRYLRDGETWWLLIAERHDEKAPLVGDVVPAPATYDDFRNLRRIVEYAGGNPKKELMRTGAITAEDRQRLIDDHNAVTDYGQVFFTWRA
jgi:hypothetical protein